MKLVHPKKKGKDEVINKEVKGTTPIRKSSKGTIKPVKPAEDY
jgi:hypothetical protein